MNTEATEYSKSASDDESARQEEAAFNPNVTDPQKQKDVAGANTGVRSPRCTVDSMIVEPRSRDSLHGEQEFCLALTDTSGHQ